MSEDSGLQDTDFDLSEIDETETDVGIINTEELHDFVVNIVRKVGFEEKFQTSKGNTFDQPFSVDKDKIKELDAFARSRLKDIANVEEKDIEFKCEVGFENLSEATYTDLDELFIRGDEGHVPDYLYLRWAVLLPDLSPAKIQVVFDTKKAENKKKTSELLMDPGPNSEIKYEIAGRENSRDWVERTGKLIEPKIESTFLMDYYYKVLKIFRSNSFVVAITWALGWLSFIVSIGVFDRLYESSKYGSKSEYRTRILESQNAEEKIDILTRYLLREENLIFEPIFEVGVPILLAITITIVGRMLFPKLAPRSGILIGSYESIWRRYDNQVKFLIVIGIFGSLITYIITTLIDLLFNLF